MKKAMTMLGIAAVLSACRPNATTPGNPGAAAKAEEQRDQLSDVEDQILALTESYLVAQPVPRAKAAGAPAELARDVK